MATRITGIAPARAGHGGPAVVVRIVDMHASAGNGLALLITERTLKRRITRLTAANRSMRRRINVQKRVEAAAQSSAKRNDRRLQESLRIRDRLRASVGRSLSRQEARRMHSARKLRDRIAQTLLGLNLRLIGLEQMARLKSTNFVGALDGVRRLAARCGRSVRL